MFVPRLVESQITCGVRFRSKEAQNSSYIFVDSTIGSVVVSLSNGKLALLKPENATGLSVTDTWIAHEYEPWVAAWNYWDTNVIYSGTSIYLQLPLCIVSHALIVL